MKSISSVGFLFLRLILRCRCNVSVVKTSVNTIYFAIDYSYPVNGKAALVESTNPTSSSGLGGCDNFCPH